jgi:hypothetical protein
VIADRPRVVLLGLDGFPLDAVSPAHTPNLHRLALETGVPPDVGVCGLPSSTYPGFATLLTGRLPPRHRVRVTATDGRSVPEWAGAQQVQCPTALDRTLAAGVPVAAVVGDHLLWTVLALGRVSGSWPPGGAPPARTALDDHGYPTNDSVRPALLAAVGDPTIELLFGQLNETDTRGHDRGPASDETLDCVRRTDSIVGEVVDGLRATWSRSVLIAVSDHDMEERAPLPPVRLIGGGPLDALADDVIVDGAAALVRLAAGVTARDVTVGLERARAEGEVGTVEDAGDGLVVVTAARGRAFDEPARPARGVHGSERTARTLSIVAGGHPAVRSIARSIGRGGVLLSEWAPMVERLLARSVAKTGRRGFVRARPLANAPIPEPHSRSVQVPSPRNLDPVAIR